MKKHLKVGGLVVMLAAVAAGGFWIADAKGRKRVELFGGGRIGPPLEGRTIDSPSDIGFAAREDGGMFVCSMAGPETGGFLGFDVMTVEGVVVPKSLRIREGKASFLVEADVVLVPGVEGAPVSILKGVACTMQAKIGGPGKAWFIMTIPSLQEAIGGSTGGIITQGGIVLRRR